MVAYRRNYVKGGTYFFTVTLADRRKTYLTDHIKQLGDAFRKTRAAMPFETVAFVILPDHLHAVWTLPANDHDFSKRWRAIKARFTMSLLANGQLAPGESLWQSRFWEHTIRDERDLQAHVDYIHFNPVKHGYTKRASDWPHTSMHRFIARGDLAHDWAAGPALRVLYDD